VPDDLIANPPLWPNYSTGSALDFDWSGRKKLPSMRKSVANQYGLPMQSDTPHQMENTGITNVSGVPASAMPEIMRTPDPISALDPSYGIHAIMKALSSAGGVPAPGGMDKQWEQLPLSKKPLTKFGLALALGFTGLGWPHNVQGATIDG